jgi:hypothetical protein
MVEKTLEALCSSYLKDEVGMMNYLQLLKIFSVGDSLDKSDNLSFAAVMCRGIFAQNKNLMTKVVAFHSAVSHLRPLNDPIHMRYAHMTFLQTLQYQEYLRLGKEKPADDKKVDERPAQRQRLS